MKSFLLGFWFVMGTAMIIGMVIVGIKLYQEDKRNNGKVDLTTIRRVRK